MTKFYQKSEIWFAIFWIILYIVGTSVAEEVSRVIGIEKLITAIFHLIMFAVLLIWILKNKLTQKYGLFKSEHKAKYFLYFLPLLILISTNFWFGVKLNYSVLESILFVVSMLCVGFIEEIIFRGFLFKAMEKDNVKSAIIVSSLTFGIGHIINLLMGASLLPSICQVLYAIAIGFLFVTIFYRGKTLLPCIITHSLVNSASVFLNNEAMTDINTIIVSTVIIFVGVVYSLILNKTLPKNNIEEKQ